MYCGHHFFLTYLPTLQFFSCIYSDPSAKNQYCLKLYVPTSTQYIKILKTIFTGVIQ